MAIDVGHYADDQKIIRFNWLTFMKPKSEKKSLLLEITPIVRFVASLLVAGAVFLIVGKFPILYRLMIGWIAFSCIYLALSWIVIFKREVAQIKQKATEDDGSTVFVFFMILVSSFANIFIVLLLMMNKNAMLSHNSLFVPLSVAGILLSWVMVHTIYTFHYAHKYYNRTDPEGKRSYGGLDFPGEKNPDYLDFAYFSFVMGSTFQVSDVSITARNLRRIALVHGVLSFVFNTFIVALTINIIAGLIQ